MPTQQQVKASQVYADLMAEVKERVTGINHVISGASLLAPVLVREFCYLQIRMICEIIALGCLVAHGDIKETHSKKFRKEWAADKIMDQLTELHPQFFPVAYKQTPKIGVAHSAMPVAQPLSKEGLLDLYHECGGALHRGTMKHLVSAAPIVINYQDLVSKTQKLLDLLSTHHVTMKGAQTVFLCVMSNADDGGKVQVAIGEVGKPSEQALADLEKVQKRDSQTRQ